MSFAASPVPQVQVCGLGKFVILKPVARPLGGRSSIMARMGWLAGGELLVVETDDDWFMGSVEVTGDHAIVRTGFVGRPTVIALEDIVRITPASEYQDEGELGG